jgi:hypothetical protein
MAEVNSDGNSSYLKQFWSAASMLTLTTSLRLIRNMKHYSSESDQQADPERIQKTLRTLRSAMHSYRGLLSKMDDSDSDSGPEHEQRQNWFPALIALHQHIYQQWYYLHQQLLFFPTDQIETVIPLVDQQLRTWKTPDEPSENDLLMRPEAFRNLDLLRARIAHLWYQRPVS